MAGAPPAFSQMLNPELCLECVKKLKDPKLPAQPYLQAPFGFPATEKSFAISKTVAAFPEAKLITINATPITWYSNPPLRIVFIIVWILMSSVFMSKLRFVRYLHANGRDPHEFCSAMAGKNQKQTKFLKSNTFGA